MENRLEELRNIKKKYDLNTELLDPINLMRKIIYGAIIGVAGAFGALLLLIPVIAATRIFWLLIPLWVFLLGTSSVTIKALFDKANAKKKLSSIDIINIKQEIDELEKHLELTSNELEKVTSMCVKKEVENKQELLSVSDDNRRKELEEENEIINKDYNSYAKMLSLKRKY